MGGHGRRNGGCGDVGRVGVSDETLNPQTYGIIKVNGFFGFDLNHDAMQFGKDIGPIIAILYPIGILGGVGVGGVAGGEDIVEPGGARLQGSNLPFKVLELGLVDVSQFFKDEPGGKNDEDEAEDGGDEVGFFLVELHPVQRALGHQVQFHRAMGEVAQAQADNFAEGMGHAGQLLEVDGGVNLDIAEGVEVLDGDVEFFGKKLGGVGHERSAAAKEEPLRRGAALLAAVKLHGLVDLNMQPGHELARDL